MLFKRFLLSFLFLCVVFSASAVDLTFKLTPSAEFPLKTTEVRRYDKIGGGGFLDLGVDLFGFLNAGAEFGYVLLPKENYKNIAENENYKNTAEDEKNSKDPTVSFIPIGVQLGAFFYPFSRIEASLGVAAGACISTTNGKNHYAPWYRGFGEIGYRINPNFSISGNASCLITQNNTWWGNPGSLGVTAGVSVKYRLSTNKSAKNITSTAEYEDSVFPLFYSIYREAPFGTLTIHNNESAEIRNVKAYFRAGKYTSADTQCGTVRLIKKNRSYSMPIVADWNNEILQFSEEGKLPGEIVVEYEFLGKKKTVVSEIIIPVYNRNQIRWSDPNGLASFISTTSQEVLEYSKTLVGISRNYLRSGLDRNMQFAMYLFNGMTLSGIECRESLDSPYQIYHTQPELIDYIQYPFQTMQFLSGDKDDIGVLFMAMLESVGIPSAFIPLDDDFIVCFSMNIAPHQIANYFNDPDKVLIINDQVWIPLSMANLREGFVNCWNIALKEIDESEYELDCFILSDAWEVYAPSGYSPNTNVSIKINEKQLSSSAETEMARYITAEIGPKITAIQEQIKQGDTDVKLYNQLGMLYVRAGMYSNAMSTFEVAAKAGSVTAMNNLGNVCTLQKKTAEAKKWYSMALTYDPSNETARKNLSRLDED